jgi:hypothetical protein
VSTSAINFKYINSYHHWNVDPGVRLARDVELVALILRESSEPGNIVITYYYTEKYTTMSIIK